MHIIHKQTFKIHTIEEKTLSQFDHNKYAVLSDALKQEIESKYYQDGVCLGEQGAELPNMVDLHLIQDIMVDECNEVLEVVYNVQEAKIDEYLANKREAFFRGKDYKASMIVDDIFPGDLLWIFDYAYASLDIIMIREWKDENTHIIIYFNEYDEKILTACQNNSNIITLETK